jgi:hypothetical protein
MMKSVGDLVKVFYTNFIQVHTLSLFLKIFISYIKYMFLIINRIIVTRFLIIGQKLYYQNYPPETKNVQEKNVSLSAR